MIEFDKWNMKQLRVIPPFEGKRYYSLIDAERKAGWEAALEWALEQETWIGPDDGGEWGIDKYEIEEELNGKT